jgi:PucR C-terminal helix-turn-helix domain
MVAPPRGSGQIPRSNPAVTRHNLQIAATVSPLTALVGRIDRDSLAERMFTDFRKEIPGYARLPDSVLRGEIVQVIRENLNLCLDWVAGGRAPSADRFDVFRASAKHRAAEGMPLEDVLRAYRVGGRAAWRALVAEATKQERDALPRAVELIMEYVDRVSSVVAAAYMEEKGHHVSEQERGVRALLDALVNCEVLDAGHYATAERIGFAVSDDLAAFAIAIPGSGASAHARAAAALRGGGTLALTEGERVVGLMPVANDPAGALPEGAVVVVDDCVPREQLAASLADVRLGMDAAVREGLAGVVALRDLALDLLLARSPRLAADLRRRILGPLAEAGARSDLLHTVEVYVAVGCDRRHAAEQLHIHPNTLDHRLRKARKLTGLDLDDPEDLATMVLALHQPEPRRVMA